MDEAAETLRLDLSRNSGAREGEAVAVAFSPGRSWPKGPAGCAPGPGAYQAASSRPAI